MTIKPADKQIVLNELEESDLKGLGQTLDLLDSYTVTSPSPEATDRLLAALTPVFEDQTAPQTVSITSLPQPSLREGWQLVLAQTRLLSRWFIFLSICFLLLGVSLTNALDGNTLRFMTNASPLLGILTILYQFRANYNNMSELEAVCPYTPAQLAAARLLTVLCYDILICLAATLFISTNYALWQVVLHWLSPLLLSLGIALISSLKFGIGGGCLVSAAIWALNLAANKNDSSLWSLILPNAHTFSLDLLSAALGLLFIGFSFKHLNSAWTPKIND